MKTITVSIALLMQIGLSAQAASSITCAGEVQGINFLGNHDQTELYPVQVTIQKNENQGYVLSYTGPVYSLANNANGFSVTLNENEHQEVLYTTGSLLSIRLGIRDQATHFSLDVESNRLTKQTTASFNYADGKPLALLGSLTCK